ncbi:FkbM family methyltransferase [Paraneptunicella aestuarii]|uniref:FkbM family methyltransferase n=1 Tax=Paraneptunicella aestuarii TaxID=2831148 RepID=UPI001E57207D|nr:FkbM family methyltransferase [Paraneptunicella aestuarii]UAA39512.1 FkbM family methyltransferase [Paraneptunicella aestuarii]
MTQLDTRFTTHHIGARYGNGSFPELGKLEQGFVKVLYDADAECIDEAQSYNQNSAAEVLVLPYCISEYKGSQVPFNINHDPFTSSLYELNPEYENHYSFVYGFDYPLKESFSVNEQILIDTVSLDELFERGAEFPPPDFLSLDVQGAELDILKGATKTLNENVLAICLEVEFVPLYKEQSCFGEICEYLDAKGFTFARFLDLHEYTPHRGSIGTRAKGFHSYANALFIRKVETLDNLTNSSLKTLMLKKLAFIALIYDQMEFSVACLNRCTSTDATIDKHSSKPEYLKLIDELIVAIQQLPKVYPTTFKKVLNSPNGKNYPNKEFFTYVYQLDKVIHFLCEQLQQQNKHYSSIETLLRAYGLNTQAELLWENRVKQSLFDDELSKNILKESGESVAFFYELIQYLKQHTIAFSSNREQHLNNAIACITEFTQIDHSANRKALTYSIASFLKAEAQHAVSKEVFEELKNLLEKEPQKSPILANTYFHLGELELQSGHSDQAKHYFQLCLSIIPEHGKASGYLHSLS